MADGTPQIRVARRARTITVADLFCGAGGLSTGATRALRELGIGMRLVGVNHWPVAIETNKRNHQDHAERIHCADLETARPLELVPEGALDLLMAAPSCVFHSRARGGRPVNDQQRMDPWHVVRWCTELRVKRLLVENVPEFVDWGPCSLVTGRPIKSRRGEYFRAWIAALQAIGFRVDHRVLCAADYGDPTTRRRFFLIGTSDRGRLQWPEPSHAADASTDLLGARPRWRGAAEIIDWSRSGSSIFTRKKPLAPNTLRRIRAGAIRYGWPQPYVDALDALLEGREPVLDIKFLDAVDWVRDNAALGQTAPLMVHLRGTSEDALGRTAMDTGAPVPTLTTGSHVGLVMATGATGAARDLGQPIPTVVASASPHFIKPLVVSRHGFENNSARDTSAPLYTASTRGAGYLAEPFVFRANQGDGRNGSQRAVSEPLPTATCSESMALVVPITHTGKRRINNVEHPLPTVTGANRGELTLVAPYYGSGSGLTAAPAQEPLPAITTKARFGLAEPVAHAAPTENPKPGNTTRPGPAREPETCLGRQPDGRQIDVGAAPFLVPNLGERDGQEPRTHSVDAPLPTVTASGHIQLAQPIADSIRIDIHYRMLHYRELARAMSFDDEGEVYDFAGNATEITKQIGNAVPGRLAKALVRALMEDAA